MHGPSGLPMRISRPVSATAGASAAPSAAATLAAVRCSEPDGSASACSSCRSSTAASSSAATPAPSWPPAPTSRPRCWSRARPGKRRTTLHRPSHSMTRWEGWASLTTLLAGRVNQSPELSSWPAQPVDPGRVGRADQLGDPVGVCRRPRAVRHELAGHLGDVAAEPDRAQVVQLWQAERVG